jgi:anti-sigma factor RsiW
MTLCEQILRQLTFYLDDELCESEKAEVELHLQSCANCEQIFTREKEFFLVVRKSKPIYKASEALQARINQTLSDITPLSTPISLRQRIQFFLGQPSLTATWTPLVWVILLVTIGTGLFWYVPTVKQPSEIAMLAINTHLKRLAGQLPLEIKSDSPAEISQWFAGKVPFQLKLPNYQESSGQDKLYGIEGARLIAFKNDYAAFVAYQMQARPITLVATASTLALPAGGEEIVTKGISFHCESIAGQKVITWTDRGLTYALVSDLAEHGQQSCIVCHTGTKDRDFMEALKPLPPTASNGGKKLF